MARFKDCKQATLTPVQLKLWEEARTAMLASQPAFSDIWYSLMTDDAGKLAAFLDDLPAPAATDGFTIAINPGMFFADKFTLKQRVFILSHEILHCVFNHIPAAYGFKKIGHILYENGDKLPFPITVTTPDGGEVGLDNIAMDYVINAILVESSVGDCPKEGCHDTNIATSKDVWIDIYRKLYKQAQQNGKGGKGKGGVLNVPGKGFDKHMEPGELGEAESPELAAGERNEGQWKTTVEAAMQAAKLQGSLPAGLERIFAKVTENVVDWREHLHALVTKCVGRGTSSWDTLDDHYVVRGVGAPGHRSNRTKRIYIGCDTSGSIDQTMLDRFLSEVAGIMEEIHPETMILMQCDAAIHDKREITSTDELSMIKIKGGGGTAFEPVFDSIEQDGDEPDMLIYFTDLHGSFPSQAPAYPVIWGCINEQKAPFGETVFVPLGKVA